jgi:hypothetical protein
VVAAALAGRVEMLGGTPAARALLEKVLLKLKSTGMQLESLSFPKPPEFLSGGGRRFAVVPTLSVISASGQQIESLNFQLGVLEPNATRWTYVEGSRINKDNIQVLFPGFPSNYNFPAFYRRKV